MTAIREEYQVMVPTDASPDTQFAFNELNQILHHLQQLLSKIQGLNDLTPEFVNDIDIGNNQINSLKAGVEDSDAIRKDQAGVLGAALTPNGIVVASGVGSIISLDEASDGQLPIGDTDGPPILATLTGTANQITIANAAGSITLSIANAYGETLESQAYLFGTVL